MYSFGRGGRSFVMAWIPSGSLKGPQGDPGPQGEPGSQGSRGTGWFTGSGAPGSVPGAIPGDLYLDQTSGDVYVLS